MNKIIKNLKTVLPSIIIGFGANLLMLVAFLGFKKLPAENFATVNYGIYIFTLVTIFITGINQWMTIRLSKTEQRNRIELASNIFGRMFVPSIAWISLLSLLFMILDHKDWPIILINGFVAIFSFANSPVQALISAREKFLVVNLINLVSPVIRLVLAVFVINNDNFLILFLGFLLSVIVIWLIGLKTLSGIEQKSFKELFVSLYSSKASNLPEIKISTIVLGIFTQLSTSSFFLFDGIFLKRIVTESNYNSYVTYAYIYKFPLFLSTTLFTIMLGKNLVTEEDKKSLRGILGVCLAIIMGVYGSVILLELIQEGLILKVIGYSGLKVPGLSLIFGLSWLTQTVCYFSFVYNLKVLHEPSWLRRQIFVYALMLLPLLYLGRENLKILMLLIFAHGFFNLIFTTIYKKMFHVEK